MSLRLTSDERDAKREARKEARKEAKKDVAQAAVQVCFSVSMHDLTLWTYTNQRMHAY